MLKQLLCLHLIFTLFLTACSKEEEEVGEDANQCSFAATVTYTLSRNPTNDFIAPNVATNATVSESSCDGIFLGAYPQTVTKFVTRVDDVITLGMSEEAFEDYIFNLNVSGTNLTPITMTHCNEGVQTTEQIISGTLDSATNKMTISVRYSLRINDCEDTVDPIGYEHTELRGLWDEPCVSNSQHSRAFYRNGAIDLEKYFSSGTCTGHRMTIQMDGPAVVGPQSSYPKDITTSYQNYFVTVSDSALVSSFNSLSMCGYSNWTTGSYQNVKGRFCDFAANGIRSSITFPSAEFRQYDIFTLTGSVLTFGDSATGDKSVKANRPTAVDNTQPFDKNPSFFVLPDWLNI